MIVYVGGPLENAVITTGQMADGARVEYRLSVLGNRSFYVHESLLSESRDTILNECSRVMQLTKRRINTST